jgi:hypothetical protein
MPFFLISTLHAWNVRLVPFIGFPLNALLFWLVWTKTPKEMRVHSRILLQTCCVDLIFLSVLLIATSVREISIIIILILFLQVLVFQGTNLVFILDGYLMRPIASIFHNDPLFYILLNFLINLRWEADFIYSCFNNKSVKNTIAKLKENAKHQIQLFCPQFLDIQI